MSTTALTKRPRTELAGQKPLSERFRSKQQGPDVELPSWSTPTALIEMTTRLMSRMARLAPYATPYSRLRLAGELALVETALDSEERYVEAAARHALSEIRKRKRLPRRAS